MYNIVDQLISCSDIKDSGRTVVLDIAYVTILLFRDVATVWKIKMVGTIGKQLKHLLSRFSDMKSSSKRWIRGFSRSLHNDGLPFGMAIMSLFFLTMTWSQHERTRIRLKHKVVNHDYLFTHL